MQLQGDKILNYQNLSRGFSFWNSSQLEINLPKRIFYGSFLANPYKSEEMIQRALQKGIKKMVVSDLSQIDKINSVYSRVKKKFSNNKSPHFIFKIDDFERDFLSLHHLNQKKVYIQSLLFDENLSDLQEIQNFVNHLKKSMKHPLTNKIVQIPYQAYQNKKLNDSFKYDVLGYQQTEGYKVICRVLGRDKRENMIFSDDCYSLLCDNPFCCRRINNTIVEDTFWMGNEEWAVLKPKRMIGEQRIIDLTKMT